MVIFGAAGDLTKRLIVPALYNLRCGVSNGFQLVSAVDHNARTVEHARRPARYDERFVACDGEFQVDHIDHAACDG